MLRPLKSGFYYFLIIFSIGFVLGGVRVLILTPQMGELAALGIEIPIMLSASWIVSRKLKAKYDIHGVGPTLQMGALALLLLLAAEFCLAHYGFGSSFDEFINQYSTLAGAIGLGAQFAFGLIPAVQFITGRQTE